MYLRVDRSLRVPVVGLQHPNGRVPVDAREAHELCDGILLLRRVCWRHLVLVGVPYARDRGGRVVRSIAGVERNAGWGQCECECKNNRK
jgi:hypothetical protein